MNPLDLLMLILATWYLSKAITGSDGPFMVFKRLRTAFPLGGLTSCILCAAIWLSALLFFVLQLVPTLVYIVAIAGGALLLHRYTGGDHV